MNSSVSQTPHVQQRTGSPQRQPATIAELAERVIDNHWDPTKPLKHYLRLAEKHRSEGKQRQGEGDLETAFVCFARAASLILEKLPTHPDYHTMLTSIQRHNLSLNGQDILDQLAQLKPKLIARYDDWVKAQNANPTGVKATRPPDATQNGSHGSELDLSKLPQGQYYQVTPVPMSAEDYQKEMQRQAKTHKELESEMAQWRLQQEAFRAQKEEDKREHQKMLDNIANIVSERKKDAAVHAARVAAGRAQAGGDDYTFSKTRAQNTSVSSSSSSNTGSRKQDALYRYDKQQEEMRRREQEIVRKREEKRKREQEGIMKRQQEADEAAKAVRQTIAANNPGLTVAAATSSSSLISTPSMTYSSSTSTSSSLASTPSSSFYQSSSTPTPAYPHSASTPQPPKSRPSSFVGEVPSIMPLESPTRYDGDSDDTETVVQASNNQRRKSRHAVDNTKTPTRPPGRSPAYPLPVTTTSPPPPEGTRIDYPTLMSQHQKTQGYSPSPSSMFTSPSEKNGTNWYYPSGAVSSLYFPPETSNTASKNLYPSNMLPPPSQPYGQGMPQPPVPNHPSIPASFPSAPYYPGPTRPAPPVPEPPPPASSATPTPGPPRLPVGAHFKPPAPSTSSVARKHSGHPPLRKISLPRECLPRFANIAKANTDMNLETCGLLLGKDKGNKFVVTTLLIPKQHSTSDTCTMDEEELVMQFTEERSMITLGWIHTHPSQSCFMSSVDLHTHSGFQRMLPESFAVVCAPKSEPNYGIFRLTDPPGLKTVLNCTATEAFHPHPDLPIYTDADKGHVSIKDIPLEIVDLR